MTREVWERSWPNKQTRYLAFCNATDNSPPHFNGVGYMAWINRHSAAFCAAHGIKREFVPADMDDAFTDYLWERSEAEQGGQA